MSQPNSQPPQENTRWQIIVQAFKSLGMHLLSLLFYNWPTKLLAIALAIALWTGLITQDPTLTRERIFTNVPVTLSSTETLKRNGFIVVSDTDELLRNVAITVDVPQMQYNTVMASNYNVRIDLSRIKQAGTQEVRIQASNSSTYGTVSAITPTTVELEIDEYITRYRIPLTVQTVGEPPEGYYAAAPSLDPPTIAVSGPRKLVEQIVQAECIVDQAKLPAREGTVRRAVPFTLLSEDGNVITSDLLQVTSESVLLDSIIVEQKVYPKKDIPMAELGLVRGTPADGYEVKGVYVTPSTVTAAGRKSILDTIDLLYASTYVDVANKRETISETLRIRQPVQLAYVSVNEITVTVEIGPALRTRTFINVPIRIRNLSNDLSAQLDMTSGTVHLTGEAPWLDTLYGRSFTLSCDVDGLAPGTYELPLAFHFPGGEGQSYTFEIDPVMVQVTIEETPSDNAPANAE